MLKEWGKNNGKKMVMKVWHTFLKANLYLFYHVP